MSRGECNYMRVMGTTFRN